VYGEEGLALIEYTPRNIGVAAGKMTCVKLTSERIEVFEGLEAPSAGA
jgi:hypothetical protein